eukprot:PhF_6_TR19189/c0_g1_i2/m.28218
MPYATVYTTTAGAVRKTADDCRRLLALFDALRIKYENVIVDTPEMRSMVEAMSQSKLLPQCFVGETFVGNYDDIMLENEDGTLSDKLRKSGYSEDMRAGESSAPKVVKKVVVKKKVIVKKAGGGEEEAPPPPPEEDGDAPPPPPEEDGDAPPPPPEDDGEAPPPPPEDEGDAPPPPPEDEEAAPPPPPDDDPPPPPPEE